jgi:SagB-type dehydrogenase family enzyme
MKHFFFVLFLILFGSFCAAQIADTIHLPDPVKLGGKPLMQALSDRHSSRNYEEKELSPRQMADMLWAAYGINRPDGRRTVPSARNRQEIDLYITTASGTYLYDAEKNSLIGITGEDIRAKTGNQPFVKDAAVTILYVCNKSRSAASDETGALINAAFTAGACAQNVYLYCASEGLGSVVRGSFSKEELPTLLKLNDQQVIIMVQTVGYLK